MTRRFLFLQGPPSPFARELGRALAAEGQKVRRINFCPADHLYWRGPEVRSYFGGLDGWPDFLGAFIRAEGITDILYFADQLPFHRAARRVAHTLGINAISYEFGYLRPDWILFEKDGQSMWSHFPSDLSQIRGLAEGLPEPDTDLRYPHKFSAEAANEILFNLTNSLLWFLHPKYDADTYYFRPLEYPRFGPRLLAQGKADRHAQDVITKLEDGSDPYFVVPLQLQSDYQLRRNSPYPHQGDFIDEVLASFAGHGAAGTRLIFKEHPQENGIESWPRRIKKMVARPGLADRVDVISGGNLARLLKGAAGVVTINSTTGLHALQAGCPVKTTGIATYDIPGLTHQDRLDTFWQAPFEPDAHDVAALVRLLAHDLHVKGCFYTAEGREAAIQAILPRLIAGEINGKAYVAQPPRIARAKAMGIEVD